MWRISCYRCHRNLTSASSLMSSKSDPPSTQLYRSINSYILAKNVAFKSSASANICAIQKQFSTSTNETLKEELEDSGKETKCAEVFNNSPSDSSVSDKETKEEVDYSWTEKLVYSSFLHQFVRKEKSTYQDRIYGKAIKAEIEAKESYDKYKKSLPLGVLYKLSESPLSLEDAVSQANAKEGGDSYQFPFQIVTNMDSSPAKDNDSSDNFDSKWYKSEAEKLRELGLPIENILDDPTYSNEITEAKYEEMESLGEYGIEDPTVPPSKQPCQGCGALLHCQNKTIPGYVFRYWYMYGKREVFN